MSCGSQVISTNQVELQAAVLNATSYSIIATRLDGTIEIFNTGAEKMLGYTSAEMVGLQTPAIIHDLDEVVARAAELSVELGRPVAPGFGTFVALADLGAEDAREWTYIRKDGSKVSVLLKVTAVKDGEGCITAYLGIAQDITDRKQHEAQMLHSRNRLASIFAAMGEGLVVQDPTGRIIEWNQAAEEILGLSGEQLGGTSSLDPAWHAIREDGQLYPGAEHPAMLCLCTGKPVRNVTMGICMAGGVTVWILINSQPLLDAEGRVIAAVTTFADITQRRAHEQQLRASMREIVLLKTVLDEHAIVAFTDAEGRITYANDRFCNISGYSSGELLGNTHRIVNSGQHPPALFAQMWKQISSGRIWQGELCNRAKDGHLYWVETTIMPFMDGRGRVERYIAIRTDITERMLLEADLATARDQALESARLKSEFLATMSHEIRTPMNGVIGMAELLMGSLSDEKQLKMGHTIQSCARNLLVIINDILDLSKIEAGHLKIQPEPFSLSELVHDTVALFEPRTQEKGITLRLEMEGEFCAQRQGDPARIRQVLSNLLGNAIKFTDRGSVRVEVLGTRDPGSGVEAVNIRVADSGIGIPDSARSRLFAPFVQVDGSVTKRYGGTGLGLAISRRLVELMHGQIGFESEEGRGSVFWFTLPMVRVKQAAPGLSVGYTKHLIEPISDRSLRILLVEDNEVNQMVAHMMLERLGLKADLASNGEDAVAMLEKQRYDIVLMDCQMPVMDGFHAASLIREGRRPVLDRQTYIVALTANAMADDRKRCLESGMNDYLSKPISLKHLSEALKRACVALGRISTPS